MRTKGLGSETVTTSLVELCADPIDTALRQAEFQALAAAPGAMAGAVVSMVGLVRGVAKDGTALTAMRLDHHDGATLLSMRRIAADAEARFDLLHLLVCHRTGLMRPGDAVVLVAAAAAHRRAAFEAVDYVMDRLKSQAVFWKQEIGVDGQSWWIEPTDGDAADLARWA